MKTFGLHELSVCVLAIAMPSQQYYLQLDDNTIATLDTKTSVATGIEFGDTEIKLKDKSILYQPYLFCCTQKP